MIFYRGNAVLLSYNNNKDIHLMFDLRLYWNVDIFVPPDTGPGLRYGHLGRHHAVAVVAVRHGAGGRGGGGEGRGRRWQVIIAGVDVVDVIVLKYHIIYLPALTVFPFYLHS